MSSGADDAERSGVHNARGNLTASRPGWSLPPGSLNGGQRHQEHSFPVGGPRGGRNDEALVHAQSHWLSRRDHVSTKLSVPGLTISVIGGKAEDGQMESSLGGGAGPRNDHAEDETVVKAPDAFAAGVISGLSVYESSFPARVAAFLRFSPVIEAAQAARRRGWPDGSYDIVTLALTAIDLVVSQQGFEMEATRADEVDALAE